jgi:hypothetical protein
MKGRFLMKNIDDNSMALIAGGGDAIVRDIGQFLGGFWEGVKLGVALGPPGMINMGLTLGVLAVMRE